MKNCIFHSVACVDHYKNNNISQLQKKKTFNKKQRTRGKKEREKKKGSIFETLSCTRFIYAFLTINIGLPELKGEKMQKARVEAESSIELEQNCLSPTIESWRQTFEELEGRKRNR